MKDGPFKNAVEAEKEGIIKEEYSVYRKRNGRLIKEVHIRDHKKMVDDIYDYHDTSTVMPLVEIKE